MGECFNCGSEDHGYRDCPIVSAAPAKQPQAGGIWCGACDERTRLIERADGRARRCHLCHPLRGRELAQHRKCPGCSQRVYAWDNLPCGSHQALSRARA